MGTKEELTVSILVPNGGRQIDWGSDRAHFVHIAALEKGKDIISCEGGAEGEGEGEEGGEFNSSASA